MKLCLTNISFKNLTFVNFIKKVKLINSRYLELAPGLISKRPLKKRHLKKIKDILIKNDLKIIGLQSIFYNCKKIDLEKTKGKKYLIKHFTKIIKIARYLSIKQVSIGSCPSRKIDIGYRNLYTLNHYFFNKFAAIAKKSKIKICLEPISKKYGNFFLKNPIEVLNFIKKIKKGNIRLLLDTGNLELEKMDLKKVFSKNQKIIEHVQLSNKNLNELNLRKIQKQIKFLKNMKFKKTVSIEYLSSKGKNIIGQKNLFKSL